LTDSQLIQDAIQGNDAAFKELVQKYESRVAATVIGMLGPGQEAEDMGQETFIRFYRNMKNFRGEASVATYLTRIAMNLCLNTIKRRKKIQFLRHSSMEDDLARIPDPHNSHYDDTGEILRKALDKLTPEFRSVVVLRFFEEYSIREIADILSIPQGTVLSRLARSQKKLKEILTPVWGDIYEEKNLQSAAQVL
jgi:RNA polymerase sigma-70 factor, ECF subfamily